MSKNKTVKISISRWIGFLVAVIVCVALFILMSEYYLRFPTFVILGIVVFIVAVYTIVFFKEIFLKRKGK
jgi:hypothetical protein